MIAETLCRASAILRGTEPVSALTRALLILLRSLLSVIFFFLDFVSGDLVLTVVNFNTTIRLALFWRT